MNMLAYIVLFLKKGTPIGNNDTMIASNALNIDTVLTQNPSLVDIVFCVLLATLE